MMTGEQFETIALLIRAPQSPSRDAARLMLVDGYRNADAARAAGCSPASANNASQRYTSAYNMICASFLSQC